MDYRLRGLVALILSIATSFGVLMLTAAALYDVIRDPVQAGISPEYSALITTTLGVIVGGLVGYIGGNEMARPTIPLGVAPGDYVDDGYGDGSTDDPDYEEPVLDPYDEQLLLDEPEPEPGRHAGGG